MANLFDTIAQEHAKTLKERQDKYFMIDENYIAMLDEIRFDIKEFTIGVPTKQYMLSYYPLIKSNKEGAFLVDDTFVELSENTRSVYFKHDKTSMQKIFSLLDGQTKYKLEDLENIENEHDLIDYFSELNQIIKLNALCLTNNDIPEENKLNFEEKGFLFDNIIVYTSKTNKKSGMLRDDKYNIKQLSKFKKANVKTNVDAIEILNLFNNF